MTKKWKEIIYSQDFQKKIRPINCCGKEEWAKLGAGTIEPRIPLAYFEHPDERLMLVPGHLNMGMVITFLEKKFVAGQIDQGYRLFANYPSFPHWVSYKAELLKIRTSDLENLSRTLSEDYGQGATIANLVDTFVIGLMEELQDKRSPFSMGADVDIDNPLNPRLIEWLTQSVLVKNVSGPQRFATIMPNLPNQRFKIIPQMPGQLLLITRRFFTPRNSDRS